MLMLSMIITLPLSLLSYIFAAAARLLALLTPPPFAIIFADYR